MFDWYEIEAQRRHRERLQEADHERLLRLASAGRGNSARLRGRALVWLGHRLVESGRRLEADNG
ncbi:MAG: hypothetical protein WCD37_14965 [Chloroflexia bacterium]